MIDSGDPDEAAERKRKKKDAREDSISDERNRELPLRRRIEWRPGLKDFYNAPDYDEDKVEENDRKNYQKFLDKLDDEQRAMLRRTTRFYVVHLSNKGGLVMPVPMRIHYADSTSEDVQLPAEIWRVNSKEVKRLFLSEKEIVRLEIDPKREIADTDGGNNHWPPKLEPSRFKLYQSGKSSNPMRKAAEKEKAAEKQKAEEEKKKAASADKPSDEASKKSDEGKKPKGEGEKAEPAKPKKKDEAGKAAEAEPKAAKDKKENEDETNSSEATDE